jgi:hypothetical protein
VTTNLAEMIRRKEWLRLGTDEALEEAEEILDAVERRGGLSTAEVYALMAH